MNTRRQFLFTASTGLAAHRALGFEETARVVNFRKTLVRS